jgi:hypothetical protein
MSQPFITKQSAIRVKRRQAEAEVREAQAALTVAKARLAAVKDLCEHPMPFPKQHYDGSSTRLCPDCGGDIG